MLRVHCSHAIPGGLRLEVDLEVGPGGLALHGPSGAGKSTLLHMIAGLVTPDAGSVVLDSRSLFESETACAIPPQERRIGLVPQDPLLFPLHDVEANLRFGQPSSPSLSFELVAEALGLAPLLRRFPSRLSGGERQRVAIGRALLSEPRALLLDEPFSALDPATRERTITLLRETLQELESIVLLVTHRRGDAVGLVSEHRMLLDGKVQEESAQS